jgi:K+-sensing histidine kinase KdpD
VVSLSKPISLQQFLEKVAQKTDDNFGKQFRGFFADNKGSAELAMLASPSKDEIEQLKKAVAIMTADEIKNAGSLTDEQVKKIARDAGIDSALLAIFINGYAIHCKRVS